MTNNDRKLIEVFLVSNDALQEYPRVLGRDGLLNFARDYFKESDVTFNDYGEAWDYLENDGWFIDTFRVVVNDEDFVDA